MCTDNILPTGSKQLEGGLAIGSPLSLLMVNIYMEYLEGMVLGMTAKVNNMTYKNIYNMTRVFEFNKTADLVHNER